jgi:hypothetical protein
MSTVVLSMAGPEHRITAMNAACRAMLGRSGVTLQVLERRVAAMGQLRAVLNELLIAEADLAKVLQRAAAFAARTPELRAATLALAVLDPVGGTLQYATCGHPPPMIVAADGSRSVVLDGTGTGPPGSCCPPAGAGRFR